MRVLSVDLGSKRVGLALSDEDQVIASPLAIVEPTGMRALLSHLKYLAKLHAVERFVVGLPLHMDGHEGPEARNARTFAERLHKATRLPVELWDERWSTVAAERTARERGKGSERVDDVAAAWILQAFLDSRKPTWHPNDEDR